MMMVFQSPTQNYFYQKDIFGKTMVDSPNHDRHIDTYIYIYRWIDPIDPVYIYIYIYIYVDIYHHPLRTLMSRISFLLFFYRPPRGETPAPLRPIFGLPRARVAGLLCGCLKLQDIFAIEQNHLYLNYPIEWVIFHSYLSLPEDIPHGFFLVCFCDSGFCWCSGLSGRRPHISGLKGSSQMIVSWSSTW